MSAPKCQAKDPSACVDPQCPERRDYRHQMATATNFNQFEAAAKKKQADEANRRKQQFQKQALTSTRRVETTREGDPVVKFHKEIGFPTNFTPPQGVRQIVYSRHAQEEAMKDRYGDIPQMDQVNLSKMELIELKINANTRKIYRFLYRTELDDNRDICLVLQPAGPGKMMVVTNWINERSDAHKTLNRNEYAKPLARAA